jgi:hypothetical protein
MYHQPLCSPFPHASIIKHPLFVLTYVPNQTPKFKKKNINQLILIVTSSRSLVCNKHDDERDTIIPSLIILIKKEKKKSHFSKAILDSHGTKPPIQTITFQLLLIKYLISIKSIRFVL